jgi:hypothetical protein
MQRPYRRLESKQTSSLSGSHLSLDDFPASTISRNEHQDIDEEAGVKGKTMAHINSSVAILARNWFVTTLWCCVFVVIVLGISQVTSRMFSPRMPTSLTNFLEQEKKHKELSPFQAIQDSTLFYSSQSIGLRYCNSSISYHRNHHHGTLPLPPAVDNITIVVYAGESRHNHPGFNNFLASLRITGFKDITIIEPPPSTREINKYTHANYSGEANFWKERLQSFYQKTLEFPSDAILLYCDAFDTLFTQPPSILLKRFRMMNSDIVFSTEILCDTVSCRRDLTLKDFFVSIAPEANPYKYINAGMFMGKASALREFMICALGFANNGRDDQTAFSHCFHHFFVANHNISPSNKGKKNQLLLFCQYLLFLCFSSSHIMYAKYDVLMFPFCSFYLSIHQSIYLSVLNLHHACSTGCTSSSPLQHTVCRAGLRFIPVWQPPSRL